ncbi:MAG: ABC transporter related protein [Microgenomates group bacterium GW2011_GWA2_40_6]|nr:MAG: ABC transporter related protein [Microgenomates group bacterium GW2011_GWA2_40_6]
MTKLNIGGVNKSYLNGQRTIVFHNLNLEIKMGEFVSIFGPNGCGKSTLLNIIGGITEIDRGKVEFDGKPINEAKIGCVFQDYKSSLFPWLNIKNNIGLPLKLSGVSSQKRNRLVDKLLRCHKVKFKTDIYPYELSGGQQQLVALLRSLIIKPDILLLDEPFSSLDYQTTLTMLNKLSQIWQKNRITTLFVSHEIDDALFLGQKIILLSTKPTKILKIFSIPLPYPRDISVMASPEFNRIKNQVLKLYSQQFKGGLEYES